jgi:DNA replication protein DnaC
MTEETSNKNKFYSFVEANHASYVICDQTNCSTCEGTGKLRSQGAMDFYFVKKCHCQNFRNRLSILTNAEIPGRFHDCDFENYHPKHDSQELAKTKSINLSDSILSAKKGLIFIGNPGLGKTHLAISLLKSSVLNHDISGIFLDFSNLLSSIRDGFSKNRSERDIFDKILNYRLIVIDELGKGRQDTNWEWGRSVLDDLISQIYNAGNIIPIFTTNYLLDREKEDFFLGPRIGLRSFSRIQEMCDLVSLNGLDDRQKNIPNKSKYMMV